MLVNNIETKVHVSLEIEELRIMFDSLQDHEHNFSSLLNSLENENDRESVEDEVFATRRLKNDIMNLLDSIHCVD